MSSLHLKIVTPEKEIYDGEATQVNISTEEGELGILPHHTNLMAKLKPGELRVKQSGKLEVMAIGEGFLQMADNVLTILTDLAENPSEIDEKAVEEAKKRAEETLTQKLSNEEHAEILSVLEKSIAQLQIKRRHKTRL